jgi:hypothetical protein
VGHRAPRVKKAWVIRDSSEEVGNGKTPVKMKIPLVKVRSLLVAGPSGGNRVQVGSGVPGNTGVSEAASLQLMAPLLDMTWSLRRVVQQGAEFLEEFNKSQNTQLDLLENLCSSMWEISYQLHLCNILSEWAQGGDGSEVSEGIQQVAKLGEDGNVVESAEVGVQVGTVEVVEDSEMVENVENAEVTEKVRMENKGNDDEMMKDA